MVLGCFFGTEKTVEVIDCRVELLRIEYVALVGLLLLLMLLMMFRLCLAIFVSDVSYFIP